MRLTLRVRSYREQAPENPHEKSFESFPVHIGRSNSCQYYLSDKDHYLSSNHACITFEEDRLMLRDSSRNGTYLNGSSEPLGKDHVTPIENGDILEVGDYTLTITIQVSPDDADPFDDFHVTDDSKNQNKPDPFAFRDIDTDWTPLANPKTAAEPVIFPEDPLSVTTKPPPAPVNESDWASDWTNLGADPSPDNSSKPSVFKDDLDRTSDDVSEPQGVSIPAQIPPATPTNEISTPARDRNDTGITTDAVDAFVTAAKLNPNEFDKLDDVEAMRQVGVLLNQSIEGIMQLLQARSELKNAFRSDVTRISGSGNNPLKFSVSSEEALNKLLNANTGNGYQTSEKAISEAVEDLELHQLAMLDGMKAAVRTLLTQFDPKNLEHRLEKISPIAANVPLARQAKLWQLFRDKYDEMKEEAVNDFEEMFGKEFRTAYESRRRKELGKKSAF